MWSSSISAMKWLVSYFGVIWSRESSVKHLATSCCTMLLKAVTLNLWLGFSLLWRNSLTIHCFEQRLTFLVRLHAEQNAMLGLSCFQSLFYTRSSWCIGWLRKLQGDWQSILCLSGLPYWYQVWQVVPRMPLFPQVWKDSMMLWYKFQSCRFYI